MGLATSHKPKGIEAKLKKAFGDECVYVEIQNGWQARFAFVVYTFYTGKSHKVNISPNQWDVYNYGSEIEFIKKTNELKKVIYKTSKLIQNMSFIAAGYIIPKDETDPIGLPGFVNHIKRKLEIYKKVHPQPNGQETQAMVIMMCLINESTQYL